MVKKVNITFGGSKECTWAQLQAVLQVYDGLATEYGLEKNDFKLYINANTELERVDFKYRKSALNETQIQTLNDTWATICEENVIDRYNTSIGYYEVE